MPLHFPSGDLRLGAGQQRDPTTISSRSAPRQGDKGLRCAAARLLGTGSRLRAGRGAFSSPARHGRQNLEQPAGTYGPRGPAEGAARGRRMARSWCIKPPAAASSMCSSWCVEDTAFGAGPKTGSLKTAPGVRPAGSPPGRRRWASWHAGRASIAPTKGRQDHQGRSQLLPTYADKQAPAQHLGRHGGAGGKRPGRLLACRPLAAHIRLASTPATRPCDAGTPA